MDGMRKAIIILAVLLTIPASGTAQADEFCRESGLMPGLESAFAHTPFVFGRVVLKGFEPKAKPPKVVVSLVSGQRSPERVSLGVSATYCFKPTSPGGELVVEVDGIEAARRTLAVFGSSQVREDFDISPTHTQTSVAPGVVSAKFSHPHNDKTVELYKLTIEAEGTKDRGKAVGYLKEIVRLDPEDFTAWAMLGSLYFEHKKYTEANEAFRRALELRNDYFPVWINVGMIRIAQKQY